jgi:hypothetical protein
MELPGLHRPAVERGDSLVECVALQQFTRHYIVSWIRAVA